MQLSNNFKTAIFNLVKDDTPHLALYTSSPTASGGGTEVSGNGYARKPITFSTLNLTTGEASNTAVISFANLPSATVTHFAILNAATGGTMKTYGSIGSVASTSGDEITVPVGNLIFSVAGE